MTADTRDATVFCMPALGADMTEGRVSEWLVRPGEEVARGQIVAVIETDKSDIEVEVFERCVFDEFLVQLGELVPVGAPIARVHPVGAATAPTPAAEPAAAPAHEHAPARDTAEIVEAAQPPGPATPSAEDVEPHPRRHRLTPRARRLARERGLSIDDVPGAVVTGDALLALAVAPRPAAPTDQTDGMRRRIAMRMSTSWAEIPHYHVIGRLDVTDVEARLADVNASRGLADRVVLGAVINTAIARAAAATPELNGWYRDGSPVPADGVALGVVVALRSGGILVPTITDAHTLDVDAMMAAMRGAVERARRGHLRGSDLVDASLTVTSLGDQGADSVFGIIFPPQLALVGVGSSHAEAAVVDGAVVARRVVHVTVAGDHRAHDGLTAARFLQRLAEHIEHLP